MRACKRQFYRIVNRYASYFTLNMLPTAVTSSCIILLSYFFISTPQLCPPILSSVWMGSSRSCMFRVMVMVQFDIGYLWMSGCWQALVKIKWRCDRTKFVLTSAKDENPNKNKKLGNMCLRDIGKKSMEEYPRQVLSMMLKAILLGTYRQALCENLSNHLVNILLKFVLKGFFNHDINIIDTHWV